MQNEPQAAAPQALLDGGHDPREMGRRGARQREANMAARIAENRELLMQLVPDAVGTVGAILQGDKRPNLLPAAVVVLDRTGLGPTTKTEVTVGPSEALVGLIERLDARDEVAADPDATLDRARLNVAVDVEATHGNEVDANVDVTRGNPVSYPEHEPSSTMHRPALPTHVPPETVITPDRS